MGYPPLPAAAASLMGPGCVKTPFSGDLMWLIKKQRGQITSMSCRTPMIYKNAG